MWDMHLVPFTMLQQVCPTYKMYYLKSIAYVGYALSSFTMLQVCPTYKMCYLKKYSLCGICT